MRCSDYVIKRMLFALVTVCVAITLNFLLFRALPGNAVSALRCRACTEQFKKAQIAGARPRQVASGSSTSSTSRTSPTATSATR